MWNSLILWSIPGVTFFNWLSSKYFLIICIISFKNWIFPGIKKIIISVSIFIFLFKFNISFFTCSFTNIEISFIKKLNFGIIEFSNTNLFSVFDNDFIIFNKLFWMWSLKIDKSIGSTGFSSFGCIKSSIISKYIFFSVNFFN